ncbi:hypothetical protein FH972_023206 [Carpinus fangiana]|uniref:Vacuolar protein sorting-associated protein 27 n=1 Tax=Carpinus fangiana TaxID=176857 RepID=A0A5N6KUH6_9ROSI|nr:hypothetical protein FH972_023206 [Carpinus fangiana]
MAGWFASSNSELDQQIERATSSSLPDPLEDRAAQGGHALAEEADRQQESKCAAGHPEHTCVKNGGSHFIQEIASREFIDNLTSLLRSYGQPPLNEDVKAKILELIQAWSIFAEGRYNLTVVTDAYRDLQRDGFKFPPRVEVAQSMFDSSAPPEWADSDLCMRCRNAFTMLNRKHHCRNCGNVFCGSCSSKSIPLPHLGIVQPVRVDDGCYTRITEKMRSSGVPSKDFESSKPPKTLYQGSMEPRSARVEDSFDAELKKALELSLEDVKSSTGQSSVAPTQPKQEPRKESTSKTRDDEEEDPELKAAIEASLKDMEEQKKKHAASLQSQPAAAAGQAPSMPKRDHELSLVEMENISLFSTLVERLQHQPPGTILREPQIQELYESIGTLRPKLARTYGETMSKHDSLLDLHSKLSTVVRYYDRMLEERFSNTYNSHQYGGYAQQRPQSMYPSISSASPPNGYSSNNAESFYTGQPTPQAPLPSEPYASVQSPYAYQTPQQYASPYVHHAQAPAGAYGDQPSQSYVRRGSASSGRAPSLKYRQASSERVQQTPSRSSSLQYSQQQAPSQYPLQPNQTQNPEPRPQSSYYYKLRTTAPSLPISTSSPSPAA